MKPSIIEMTEQYAFFVFSKKVPPTCYYHNWQHTLAVVGSCKVLAQKIALPPAQKEPLIIAAYLHDVGHALSLQAHEAAGVVLADRFLHNNDYNAENKKQVLDCIASTEAGKAPQNILEQILKDADLCSLGTEDGLLWSERLRLEWELLLGKCYTDVQWWELNIDFYEKHNYYTHAARQLYEPTKQANLRKMNQLLSQLNTELSQKHNKHMSENILNIKK